MGNIRIALLNIKKNFKNEKELKASFLITVFGMAINNIAFLLLWYYFGKTVGELNGWKAIDIFGLYAFTSGSFGLVTAFLGGIINIPQYISSGTFDKYLLTPKNILVKVSTSKIVNSALGDALFGLICLIIYSVGAKLSFIQILVSLYLILIACVVYYSFSLISMSVSFYLMDGSNVSQGLWNMFVSNSLYHGGAFTGILRIVFMFAIPSLLVGAVPVEIIKNLSLGNILFLTGMAAIWLIAAISFFYKSLKKYESNNLFGFGV